MRGASSKGFTLLELMLAMSLAILVYSVVATITISAANIVRTVEAKMHSKITILNAAEQMRWQLRCLHSHNAASGGVAENIISEGNTSPATLKGLSFYSCRSDKSDQDVLLFTTTYLPDKTFLRQMAGSACPAIGQDVTKRTAGASAGTFLTSEAYGGGTVEVGYRILEVDDSASQPLSSLNLSVGGSDIASSSSPKRSCLVYRQYPWKDHLGLHQQDDDDNAPWTVLCPDIVGMKVEISSDGEIWQQEWSAEAVPKWVRVSLIPNNGDSYILAIIPGVATSRW